MDRSRLLTVIPTWCTDGIATPSSSHPAWASPPPDHRREAATELPRLLVIPGTMAAGRAKEDHFRTPFGPLDVLQQQPAVLMRLSEQLAGRVRPLEVQLGVVLPGDGDATVQLDGLGRHVGEGVRAPGLGHRRPQ